MALMRPRPHCFPRLTALEQWEYIASGPALSRTWFTCSLLSDILLTAVVFICGWLSVSSPLLTLVPSVAYTVVAGGVLVAVHLRGPIPHAAVLCPAQALIKIYVTIYPFCQSVQKVRYTPGC